MTLITTIMASLIMLASCEMEERVITPNSLPQAAKQLIEAHFGDLTIAQVEKDYDDLGYDYNVYFTNGSKIEFSRNGEWKDIDCRGMKVPDAIVPSKILSYVGTTYPTNFIAQIAVDGRYYDVDLDNDLDLVFNKSGDFVRIDY